MNSSSGKAASGSEYELAAFGAIGEGGLAVQLGEVVVLEALPFIGLGGATQDITGYTSGGGGYFLYGFKGGIFFQIKHKIKGVAFGHTHKGFSVIDCGLVTMTIARGAIK